MLIELLAGGVVAAKFFYDVNESCNMDEEALNKYGRAFEKAEEAALMVRKKAALTDRRLGNVVKKKKAIIQKTLPKFVQVYHRIQKIELEIKSNRNDLKWIDQNENMKTVKALTVSKKVEFTDKELLCGMIKDTLGCGVLGVALSISSTGLGLFGLATGIGSSMKKDSERYVSAARRQMSAANVVASQAESIVAFYDAVIARADRISGLLVAFNLLFNQSIKETNRVIDQNGLDVRHYSSADQGVLMTCVNIAAAIADIIDVPVINAEGEICEEAMEMILTGERYLQKMNQIFIER